MNYRTILLFGPPGAGKGTQGKILDAIPNFFHCSSGDVLRSLKPDSAAGRTFLEYSSRGDLVPDALTVQIWRQFMEASIAAGRFHPDRDTLVLDGIPRNVHQAEMMREALTIVAIFNLPTRPEVLVERLRGRALKENRPDDTSLEVIRKRFETYEQESKPVLEFYDQKLVHAIDAGQTPPKVLFDILGYIVKI
jgi:adenylate kinase